MKPLSIKNQNGQLVVEAVLLLVVMMAFFSLVRQGLNQMEFAKKLTAEPWGRLSGMIQCGVWMPCGIGQPTPRLHPSSTARVLSLDASKEQ